jgi:hypothetical protein
MNRSNKTNMWLKVQSLPGLTDPGLVRLNRCSPVRFLLFENASELTVIIAQGGRRDFSK